MKKIYKERRLYFFVCTECGKSNRHSFKRRKAKNKVCRRCMKNRPDPNQQSLFPPASGLEHSKVTIKTQTT